MEFSRADARDIVILVWGAFYFLRNDFSFSKDLKQLLFEVFGEWESLVIFLRTAAFWHNPQR